MNNNGGFSKDVIKEMLDSAHLGLKDVHLIKTKNPFDDYPAEFYIENPHIAILKIMRNPDYFSFTVRALLGIELHPFQLVILKELWNRPFPMLIASRGASKSFCLAIYALLRCMLLQQRKVVIVGAAFRQAKVVFEYMDTIYRNSPILRDICGTNNSRSGPRRDIDRCTFLIGDSETICLPLGNGDKIRGLRAHDIIGEEFGSIPPDIYEVVIAGFAAVSSNPVQAAKEHARFELLKELELWTHEDMISMSKAMSNQSIISGTATFAFEHFGKYWLKYKAIIESQGDKEKLEEIFGGEVPSTFDWRDYSIIRLPVTALPFGFMDAKNVARSRATVQSDVFAREYMACFPSDSKGFFRRSLIERCTAKIENPVILQSGPVKFEAVLRGDQSKRYVIGIDPASEKDNFAISVLEIWPDHRRFVFCWTITRQLHQQKIKTGNHPDIDYYSFCARKVRDLMKVFPCEHIGLDSQGGGYALAEALSDKDKLEEGERRLWPIIDDNKPKESDDQEGLHIIEMVNFSDSVWVSGANHGMKKDLEDSVLFFPFLDTLSLELALVEDARENRTTGTLEDCVFDIEEAKNELAIIVMTTTGVSGRESWGTPDTKIDGTRKGRLRKDRYSALLIANMVARTRCRALPQAEYNPAGGIAGQHKGNRGNSLYVNAPLWAKDYSSQVGINRHHSGPDGSRIYY